MKAMRTASAAGALVVLALASWGCGPGGEERKAAELAAKLDAQWTAIEAAKKELTEKRAQLSALKANAGGADVSAQAQPLADEIAKLGDAFTGKLVEFLNADPIVEGTPPNSRQQNALRLKSHEDLLVAQEYIDAGGEYQRAIDILQAALLADPDNPELKAALAEAKEHRYPTEAEFGQLKKGMSQDEVRALLGPVNLRNIKEYPDKGVTAWFYKKEAGGASVVYFEHKGKKPDQPLVAYQWKWDAVKADEGGS